MTVRNEEKKAFRDLTPEERIKVFNALIDGNAEYWSGEVWCKHGTDAIFMHSVYRTRPRQLVIPWEVIRPEYKWAAMDKNGRVFVYYRRPVCEREVWNGECDMESLRAIKINTTGIDWRDSLTERPEGV